MRSASQAPGEVRKDDVPGAARQEYADIELAQTAAARDPLAVVEAHRLNVCCDSPTYWDFACVHGVLVATMNLGDAKISSAAICDQPEEP